MTQYLAVRNWSEFQHYTKRNPPWIKLHRALLDDYEFSRLSDQAKAHIMLIWLFASHHGGRVPNDPKFLQTKIGLDKAPDLKAFINQSLLIPVVNGSNVLAESMQDASVLAECKQDASNVLLPNRDRDRDREEAETETECASALPDWISPAAWKDFAEMRKSIRKPLTQGAVKGIVAKLGKLRESGQSPDGILEQSTVNAWAGVFPIKVDQAQSRGAVQAQVAETCRVCSKPLAGRPWTLTRLGRVHDACEVAHV